MVGLVLAVLSTALLLRITPLYTSPELIRRGFGPYGDTHLYHRIAYNLYKGKGFSGTDDGRAFGKGRKIPALRYRPTVSRPPVYPAFLCLVYRWLGTESDMKSLLTWHRNLDKVRIVQGVLDSLLCIIIFEIVRLMFPGRFWPAFWAAFMYCLSPHAIFYSRILLTESLAAFLLGSALLICYRSLRSPRRYAWFFTGVSFALLTLTRPEYILFIPILGILVFFLNRRNRKWPWRAVIFLYLGAFCTIIPWTMRNYTVSGRLIPVSASGIGYNLFIGTFESNSNWRGWGKYPESIYKDEAEKKKIQQLQASYGRYFKNGTVELIQIDRSFLKLALKRIRSKPIETLTLWSIRLPRLWYQKYIRMNFYDEPSGNYILLFLSLSLAAVILSKKNEIKRMLPTIALFFYVNIIFLPLHIEPRYSIPVMPGIICLSGIGMWKIYKVTLKIYHYMVLKKNTNE